jgi:hypothetical protein
MGDQPVVEQVSAGPVVADTFGGRIHVEWDNSAPVTPLGQMPFFIEFVKQGGLFDGLVADCPLHYTSPNAPGKRDVLGTTFLSVLAGHWRYAHMTTVRCDPVNPPLLGMTQVVSEDAVRRGLDKIDEEAGESWVQGHLDYTTRPLIDGEAVVLGVDGISDFNGLHSSKFNHEVQLYAFDILALDGEDLPAGPSRRHLRRRVRKGRDRSRPVHGSVQHGARGHGVEARVDWAVIYTPRLNQEARKCYPTCPARNTVPRNLERGLRRKRFDRVDPDPDPRPATFHPDQTRPCDRIDVRSRLFQTPFLVPQNF